MQSALNSFSSLSGIVASEYSFVLEVGLNMQDTTHSIMTSAKRFFSGTILSRFTGMFRDMAMAYAFGTQESVAAFLVAFRFAHLLRRLFGEGALQSAFVPQFETFRAEHPERAFGFFRDLLIYLTIGLIALILIAMSVLGFIWSFCDLSPGNSEILFLTLLLMPSLLFICLYGLNAALLQCEKCYFIPGVAPIAFNVIWIIGVIALWNTSSPKAMPWLAGWVILACFGQWLMTFPKVWKVLKDHGVYLIGHFKMNVSDLKALGKPLFLAIIGVAASQVNNAMDALFARYADAEGPALLWYALRIQQLPLALFGIAIAGALLPPLTRSLKANDISRYQIFLEFAMRRSIALMLPITAALLVMGDTCVSLLYGHGDFDANSIMGTTLCLWGYSLGLLPMALVLMLAPAFYAQGNPRIPAGASVISMMLNVGLNLLLIFGFGLGASSIAIATSFSAWVNLALLAYALTYSRQIISRTFLVSTGKILLASAGACVAVCFVDFFVLHSKGAAWQILEASAPYFPRGFTGQLSHFAIQASSFSIVLLLLAKLLNVEDLIGLVEFRRKKEVLM